MVVKQKGQHGKVLHDSRLLLIGNVVGMQTEKKFSSEVLSTMQGITSRTVHEDWLITRLGYYIYEQHGVSQKRVISHTMQTMAQFLLSPREVIGDVTLEDMTEPEKFYAVVSIVHSLG